jgi:acetyl-CoA carboxylase biotin carboxyl carrier protein
VDEDTVVGIIETMKLMTSVQAGVRGTVDAILLEDSRFVEKDGVLMRIVADSG